MVVALGLAFIGAATIAAWVAIQTGYAARVADAGDRIGDEKGTNWILEAEGENLTITYQGSAAFQLGEMLVDRGERSRDPCLRWTCRDGAMVESGATLVIDCWPSGPAWTVIEVDGRAVWSERVVC